MQQVELKYFKANTNKPIKELNIQKHDYKKRKSKFMQQNPQARATFNSLESSTKINI